MSMVERRHRLVRLVTAGSTGLFLLSSAYQASFAGATSAQAGIVAQYDGEGPGPGPGPGRPGRDDEDDDDDTAETVGIALGAAAALVGIAAATGALPGVFGGGAAGAGGAALLASGDAVILPPLPADCREYEGIRLIPRQTDVEAGVCRVFDLQVRCREDGKWYSVTNRNETTIALRDEDPCVVRQEGSKNVFCVPLSAPQTCNGRSVVVVGTFAPEGRAPMNATSRIRVLVPSTEGLFVRPDTPVPDRTP